MMTAAALAPLVRKNRALERRTTRLVGRPVSRVSQPLMA